MLASLELPSGINRGSGNRPFSLMFFHLQLRDPTGDPLTWLAQLAQRLPRSRTPEGLNTGSIQNVFVQDLQAYLQDGPATCP